MDLEILRTELADDPLDLGYAELVERGDDERLSLILNDVSGPGSGIVRETYVSGDRFLLAISPAVVRLSSLDPMIQFKWDRVISLVTNVGGVTLTDATVLGIISAAVEDGLMTQDEVSRIGRRMGSRAEVLFGAGSVITPYQCSQAR